MCNLHQRGAIGYLVGCSGWFWVILMLIMRYDIIVKVSDGVGESFNFVAWIIIGVNQGSWD